MANQLDRQARLAFADDVIANDDSIDELYARVDALHPTYLALAAVQAARWSRQPTFGLRPNIRTTPWATTMILRSPFQ